MEDGLILELGPHVLFLAKEGPRKDLDFVIHLLQNLGEQIVLETFQRKQHALKMIASVSHFKPLFKCDPIALCIGQIVSHLNMLHLSLMTLGLLPIQLGTMRLN